MIETHVHELKVLTNSVHQLVDDDAQVDAAAAQGDGLYPAGSAHTARAAIAGNDVDVGALRCSGDESGDKKT